MSQQQNTSGWFSGFAFAAVCLLVLFLLWPFGTTGCARVPGGAEISSWWGKVKVKPLPPEPPLVAPATRCLIFSAKWCGPCNQLKRNIAGMTRNGWRVGPLATDDIEIIDVDGPDPRTKQFNARSLPTLVIVDKSGKEIARKEGVMSADALGEWIRSTRK